MIILVTGTIAPLGNLVHLQLKNVDERLAQYKNALNKMIDLRPSAKIIFTENSGYGVDAFQDIVSKARAKGVEFEVLSFDGDSEAVIVHGKGYGEGEIVNFALENSRLAASEDYMVKVTGRLTVDNISEIVSRINQRLIYFNIPNRHIKDMYDTRLYALPIDVFKKYFGNAHKLVRDIDGYYLEHVYTDVILRNKLRVRNFPLYPRIVGVSGTEGIRYTYTEWKSKLRDIASIFNAYGKVVR